MGNYHSYIYYMYVSKDGQIEFDRTHYKISELQHECVRVQSLDDGRMHVSAKASTQKEAMATAMYEMARYINNERNGVNEYINTRING